MVWGDQADAKIKFTKQRITILVDYHGECTSAAIETVKILCFDIASMLFSPEGNGFHPKLLIHDCPRETLGSNIYAKFFLMMKDLENCFEETEHINFQYIVTTTEPPPKELRQSPWLINPILDASHPEGRILGVNL